MIEIDLMARIRARIEHADKRYGLFVSTHEALGVASEEWDEFRDAVRSNKLGSVAEEALDLAAVMIRLARDLENENTARRSVK